MAIKLNLGCGEKLLPGYVNCDVLPHVKADRHFDLDAFPYPFEDDTAEEIFMDNVLEHLADVPAVMGELHRILRPGGRLRIKVPYGKTDWALQDPTHKHYFTERSMDYFTVGHPYSYYCTFKFRLVEARLFGDSTNWMHKARNLLPFKNVLRYFFWNIYDGIYFELEKPEPGPSTPSRSHGENC
jgi:SAM-dependent methyltransferase